MKDTAAFLKHLAGIQSQARKLESEWAHVQAHTHSCPQHALGAMQSPSEKMTSPRAFIMICSDVPMCTMSQRCIHLCLHTYCRMG